ncbi:hypothetical protein QBC34DRAFT_407403 [Podospora aff. communis PSN243]|uniref:Uncharacterized protein n=1 Tax=Podospora aff. communis PSN243 TaxID=3040156 RepID=A0AAV9GJ98_9PEZI|nr:hypothetical protein QBC34DRAFT_407403 [Podospora aff. communis PSN243]
MSDFSCLGPDTFPASAEALVPKDLNYVILPGNDSTAPWITECCAPNPVNQLGGCYLWCEIPDSRITTNSQTGKKDHDMNDCMRLAGRPNNESRITGTHFANGSASQVGVKGFCVWAVLVVAMGMQLL